VGLDIYKVLFSNTNAPQRRGCVTATLTTHKILSTRPLPNINNQKLRFQNCHGLASNRNSFCPKLVQMSFWNDLDKQKSPLNLKTITINRLHY
jgi:hypothetical protein